MDMKRIEEIIEKMRMILQPGEYGLGTEPGSYSDDDREAWRQLNRLLEELSEVVYKRD